jgi:hypothetical protein
MAGSGPLPPATPTAATTGGSSRTIEVVASGSKAASRSPRRHSPALALVPRQHAAPLRGDDDGATPEPPPASMASRAQIERTQVERTRAGGVRLRTHALVAVAAFSLGVLVTLATLNARLAGTASSAGGTASAGSDGP